MGEKVGPKSKKCRIVHSNDKLNSGLVASGRIRIGGSRSEIV